ncbi:MAG: transglycosylase SLT domain-containing protein [Phototrophicaceae bacterium]
MQIRFSAIFLILLSLTACNLQAQQLPTPDGENNIFVTATPLLPTANADGVIMVSATPDASAPVVNVSNPEQVAPATATVSVPATPIVDARLLLDEADKLLRDGYLEEAVFAYQAILNQISEPSLRGEAAFKLGQSALREGLFQDAVTALTLLINDLPDDVNFAQAHFLRGDAYLGLSSWQLAITDFQQYLQLRSGLIDSYAYERIGDAQLALGQTESAITSYTQAINAGRPLVPQLILQERLAQIYIGNGRVDDAVALYDAILAVAQNAGYRASIELYVAQAYANAGRADEAVARATRIAQLYTETAPAYSALQILDANGVEVDSFQRGIINYIYGDYTSAIDAFNDYTSTFVLDAIPARLYLLLGRAYRELGNWEAARVAFQTLLDQYPNDPLFATALLERGRTYFLQGDFQTAINTYVAIADNYAYLEETSAEALWRAAYLYGTQLDNYDLSRETFTRLANNFPESDWALSGLQIAASGAIANNQPAVAENFYNRIAVIATGEDRASALYWVGRFALDRGDQAGAQDAFAQARLAAPDSFFAQRSNDILINREPFLPPSNTNFTFDEQADRQQAEDWLRTTFAIEQTGELSVLSPDLANDPRMIRGQELWTVAAYAEAQEEFESLLDEARSNRDALLSYQLAHFLRDIGDYYSSIVAAADVIVASGQSTLDAPPYIARMRYPAYFIGLIEEQSSSYGFDPLLMLALIRQESLFNPNATSVADALGLAQVIPSTARYIADELAWQDFTEADLYRPYVGIAFGAFYLDEQLRIFGGNEAAALAAYNAGPGYTLDWVNLSGGDVDSLVATITFDETKRYVQRIYSHYTIYRELYGVN